MATALLLLLLSTLVCFLMAFYSPRRRPLRDGEYDIPVGNVYEPFRKDMEAWQDSLRQMPYEQFEIRSRDGLTLRGKYYEYEKGAPIEIMFHGYKGNAVRDLCGGVERCFKLKRSTIIVSQRAHGDSDGHVITFGYKERLDCIDWVNFVTERFGKDQKIILTGISMGAATVLMASGEELPTNVVSIIADCGFSSAPEMIKKTLKELHLPPKLFYPIVRLGGIFWGDFDPECSKPIEAVKRSRVPIIFIHGDSDDFVPTYMSQRMYEVCPTEKSIFIAEGAAHGLAFPKDQEGYYASVTEFEKIWNN